MPLRTSYISHSSTNLLMVLALLIVPPTVLSRLVKLDETELSTLEQIVEWYNSVCHEYRDGYIANHSKKYGYIRFVCNSLKTIITPPSVLEFVGNRFGNRVYVYAGLQVFVRLVVRKVGGPEKRIELELIYTENENELLSQLPK